MNNRDQVQTELAAEWEELTELVEECPEEAEVIMDMLIEADDDAEDDLAA